MISMQPLYDGYASYGRPSGWSSTPHDENREEALEHYRDCWEQYERLGDIPEYVKSYGTADRDASASTNTSAVRGAGGTGAGDPSASTYTSVVRGAGDTIATGAGVGPVPPLRVDPNCLAGHWEIPVGRWMIDSGCGHDIISRREAALCSLDAATQGEPTTLKTANGNVSTRDKIAVGIDEFQQRAELHVLPDTPSLLSLGRRCARGGLTFVWQAYERPHFVCLDGKIVLLDVLA